MAKATKKGNGSGSVSPVKKDGVQRKNKEGLLMWQIKTCKNNTTGLPIRKYFYGTKSDAQHKLEELNVLARKTKEEIEQDKKEDEKQNTTLRNLADEMMEIKALNPKFKKATISRDESTLKIIDDLLDKKVIEITKEYLVSYFHGKTHYSQSELSKILRMTNSLFEIAIDKDLITKNPMRNWKDYEKPTSSKTTQPIRSLTLAEREKLLIALLNNRVNHSAEMLISLFTGLRGGEVLALSCENVFMKKVKRGDKAEYVPYISVEKTISRLSDDTLMIEKPKTKNGKRSFPIDKSVYDLIETCKGGRETGLIFTNNGNLMAEQVLNCQFHRVLEKYDILDEDANERGKVSFHTLRKTFATLKAYEGMDRTTLKTIMGHSSEEITGKYYLKPNDDLLVTAVMNTPCDMMKYKVTTNDNVIIADFTA